MDSLSSNHAGVGGQIQLLFSVDRTSQGTVDSAVFDQAGLFQQPGDVYRSTALFANPGDFVGALAPQVPYAGDLSAWRAGATSNLLEIDEGSGPGPTSTGLGLTAGGSVRGSAELAPEITTGSHDNLDAFDLLTLNTAAGNPFEVDFFFSIDPAEAAQLNAAGFLSVSAADVFDVAAGGLLPRPDLPFVRAAALGLDAVLDSLDALILFDAGDLHGPANGGPGAQPGLDYALFSLAPGSASLGSYALSAADVLFTDFTGAFARFAPAAQLGLQSLVGMDDNIDALELFATPEPSPIGVLAPALLALVAYGRRRLTA